jgi:hypothetical protein
MSFQPLPHAEDKLPDQCHHQGLLSQVNLKCLYKVLILGTSASLTSCLGAVSLCLKKMVGYFHAGKRYPHMSPCLETQCTAVKKRLASAFKAAILSTCFDFSFAVGHLKS